MTPLSKSRETIEAIDRELIRLVHERMVAIREVGRLKGADPDQPLRDVRREHELFEFWAAEGEQYDLSAYHLGRILRELLTWSRRDQERFLEGEDSPRARQDVVRVAFQGVRDAYSDLAARKLFASRGGALHTRGCRTFSAALDALEAEEVDYALLPVENTIVGSIEEVWRSLTERSVHVVDEEIWNVEHVLAALPGTRLSELTRVRSHPVALAQCGRFLSGLVGVSVESFHDTAASAAAVAEEGDPTCAALCSEEAARGAGLEILARDVADRRNNVTRFLLISNDPEPVDSRLGARTSIVFTVRHQGGALAACLGDLAAHGVNLTKLESRPLPDEPWEYMFHADIDGDAATDPLAGALDAMRAHTTHLRVLGSYPRRAGVGDEPVPAIATPTRPTRVPERGPDRTPLPLLANSAPRSVAAGGMEIGPDRFVVFGGPLSEPATGGWMEVAEKLKSRGVRALHAGSLSLGSRRFEELAEAGRSLEMPVVARVQRAEDVAHLAGSASFLRVEAGCLHDGALVRELVRSARAVILERGPSATLDELVHAASLLEAEGNGRVVLAERGIRTFESATRHTLDLSAVPVLRSRGPWPVLVDPTHAVEGTELLPSLSAAAAAVGADGLLLEVDTDDLEALEAILGRARHASGERSWS